MRCISVAVLALVAPYVSGELSVDTLVLLLRFSSTWCMLVAVCHGCSSDERQYMWVGKCTFSLSAIMRSDECVMWFITLTMMTLVC